MRWERRTGVFHTYSEAAGLPPVVGPASTYCEDRAGDLWIGFGQIGEEGVVRYRNGRFRLFTAADGVPTGRLLQLYSDSKGRLWIASTGSGLGRIDDPSAEQPQAFTYTTAQGLASNPVRRIVEDAGGRLFVGTQAGLDLLDPATGRVKHFTTADGLANNYVEVSFRDPSGALWFGTSTGLSRLSPELEQPRSAPPIFITDVQIPGSDFRVSGLGATTVSGPELGPGQNNLRLAFASLAFAAGETLRYQYKLEGGDRAWRARAAERTVNFASLAPGRYRFLVRAVNADGAPSERPASFSFTILPPLWQRWWFVALAASLLSALAYASYRYRVARLIELERLRTHIAADLHDDNRDERVPLGPLRCPSGSWRPAGRPKANSFHRIGVARCVC